MKKVYLLMSAAALLTSTAYSQTINFVQNGKVIPDGSTVNYNKMEILTDLGNGDMDFIINPEISVLSDEAVSLTITANCVTGQKIQLCAGSLCEKGETVTKRNVAVSANVPLPLEFDYSYQFAVDGPIPELVVTELGFKKSNSLGANEVEITVAMDIKNASVSVLELSDAIVYQDGMLVYDLDKDCTASVYDSNGKCVLKSEVSGKGSISTTDLAPGVYVYKFGNKGGKILVK